MTPEQLRQVHTARPFHPFVLRLADGRSLRVKHPEILAHHPGARTISVATSESAIELIDLLLVVSLQVGDSKPNGRKQGGNGRGGKRR